jgi:hypothetical protein
MAKIIAVTVSVSFNVEVPNSWMKEYRYVDEITESISVAVSSSNKKVVVDEENIETSYDDLTPDE